MQPMTATRERRTGDAANVAGLLADAVDESNSTETMVVQTAGGKAVVHLDRHGADVELPGGATVHVRF